MLILDLLLVLADIGLKILKYQLLSVNYISHQYVIIIIIAMQCFQVPKITMPNENVYRHILCLILSRMKHLNLVPYKAQSLCQEMRKYCKSEICC